MHKQKNIIEEELGIKGEESSDEDSDDSDLDDRIDFLKQHNPKFESHIEKLRQKLSKKKSTQRRSVVKGGDSCCTIF